jgi:uncharacterized membrane protein (UPF0127 family)
MTISLVNGRTGETLASAIELAATRDSRRRGLLGRDAIDISAAMVITPCWAIHTAFMRFPIDVVFVNGDGRVERIASRVAPWRVAFAPRAHAAIELAAGAAVLRGVEVGDPIYLRPAEGFTLSGSSFLESLSFLRMAAKPACSGS